MMSYNTTEESCWLMRGLSEEEHFQKWFGNIYNGNPSGDPLIDRVIKKFISRSEAGMKKYGVTMERPDVSTVEWLRHAQEEAMDLVVYLQRSIEDIENGR